MQTSFIVSLYYTKEMNKQCFPNSKFELMHEVNHKHLKVVEAEWTEYS